MRGCSDTLYEQVLDEQHQSAEADTSKGSKSRGIIWNEGEMSKDFVKKLLKEFLKENSRFSTNRTCIYFFDTRHDRIDRGSTLLSVDIDEIFRILKSIPWGTPQIPNSSSGKTLYDLISIRESMRECVNRSAKLISFLYKICTLKCLIPLEDCFLWEICERVSISRTQRWDNVNISECRKPRENPPYDMIPNLCDAWFSSEPTVGLA